MSRLADFHFLRPAWLLLLLALPLLGLFWQRVRVDAGAWRSAVDAHLLPHLLERDGQDRRGGGPVLAAALWILICGALAGPAWERTSLPLYRNQAARVLALELAPTMLAQDVKPSRLERARFKIDDILMRSRDRQTALIAYAGDAFVAAPLTDDVETVRNLVDSLDPSTMPVAGNATARAIARAQSLVQQAGLRQGELILLADDAGPDAVAAARRAHAQGLSVSVLGVGSTTGAPVALPQGGFLKDKSGDIVVPKLDESALRALALAGGGRYATLTADAGDLGRLLIDTQAIDHATDATMAASSRWRDRGPWLLLLVLPLALLGFRRGWLMAVALLLCVPVPRNVQAATLKDLWLRPDQQAAAALARGDVTQAARVAGTPEWRASAEYRAGDYAAAAESFGQAAGADASYNRGNALARLGQYQEALAAYAHALALEPGMADAEANREAVEEWLKRRQKNDNPRESGSSAPGNPSSSSDRNRQRQGGEDQGQPSSRDPGQESRNRQGQQAPSPQGGKTDDDADAKSGKNAADDAQASGPANDQQTRSKASQDRAADDRPPPGSDAKASAAQKQALSKAVDRALAASGKPDSQAKAQPGSVAEDDAAREKRQALDQWLERVPDDPGGLLRRKFLLEYQRRQQQGDDGG
ncbi:MAG TPA: VWA domain-containing protein [Rhodanobacteraceae bacterium]|nr:VWA domain-containing protein [Rhodanobacteraceae bacterium]